MDWTRYVDGYCERVDPSYWAEPVNAVTNLAFLLAAWVVWRRVRGSDDRMAMALCAVLAAIGVGSYLFHTHATVWAGVLDVLPILMFVLLYIFAANVYFWGMSLPKAVGVTLLFFPYAAVTLPIFTQIPRLGSSAGYMPVPLLILIYAFLLRNRASETAVGLAIGAGILIVSLTFRTLDEPLCMALPLGTHFMWHILNAVMLGWMIVVYRRHREREG